MRTSLYVLVFILSIGLNAQSNEYEIKVKSIDSTDNFYFIKARVKGKHPRKVVIVSEKDPNIKGVEKIKHRGVYLVKLSNYLSDDKIKSLPVKPKGKLLLREEGYIIWDGKSNLPYKSPNIKSMYYIKP